MSVFLNLRSIRVKHLFEKKGKLDYLNWAKAWELLKSSYPDANYEVWRHKETGENYFTNKNSGWVVVTVTVGEISHTVDLAIMDNYNNAIPKEKITSVDSMNTQQRALTKAIALHGLGLNAWTREKDFITEDELSLIIETNDVQSARYVLQYCELTNEQQQELISKFKK